MVVTRLVHQQLHVGHSLGYHHFSLSSLVERTAFSERAESLGIAARVHWRGQLDPAEIPVWLCRADVLVLPSRKDGWGAVVNEALMMGTPVICSSAVCAHHNQS